MSCLLTLGDLSLLYRTSSTKNSLEKLEISLEGKIALKPLRSSRLGEYESFKKSIRHIEVYTSCNDHHGTHTDSLLMGQHIKQVDRYKLHLRIKKD